MNYIKSGGRGYNLGFLIAQILYWLSQCPREHQEKYVHRTHREKTLCFWCCLFRTLGQFHAGPHGWPFCPYQWISLLWWENASPGNNLREGVSEIKYFLPEAKNLAALICQLWGHSRLHVVSGLVKCKQFSPCSFIEQWCKKIEEINIKREGIYSYDQRKQLNSCF